MLNDFGLLVTADEVAMCACIQFIIILLLLKQPMVTLATNRSFSIDLFVFGLLVLVFAYRVAVRVTVGVRAVSLIKKLKI